MKSLNIAPAWESLAPAFFAVLESGTEEGKALVKEEIRRALAALDSVNAAPAPEEAPRYDLAAAALDLYRAASDFSQGGAYIRAACYYEAAARIAPSKTDWIHDARVAAGLMEREAAALVSAGYKAAKAEARREAEEAAATAYQAALPPHSGVKSFCAIRAALLAGFPALAEEGAKL